jgi:hypothetical protein
MRSHDRTDALDRRRPGSRPAGREREALVVRLRAAALAYGHDPDAVVADALTRLCAVQF